MQSVDLVDLSPLMIQHLHCNRPALPDPCMDTHTGCSESAKGAPLAKSADRYIHSSGGHTYTLSSANLFLQYTAAICDR